MKEIDKKCSYRRDLIADAYGRCQADGELIKYLRIFFDTHIEEIQDVIEADSEMKVSDFFDKHLDDLKRMFEVCRETESTRPEPSTNELRVKTPKGTISAKIMKDDEYPGIATLTDSPGEPGVIVEYDPNRHCIVGRIYSAADPDGDPAAIVNC